MKMNSNNNSMIFAAIMLLFILFSMHSCSRVQEEKERKAFNNQMHKDPNTWSEEERNRYNNFIEWEENN